MVASAGAVDTAVFREEVDRLSVRTGAGARCLKPFAATAGRNAKYLSDPQTANRFIAAIVLRKWAEEGLTQEGLMTDPEPPRPKVDPI